MLRADDRLCFMFGFEPLGLALALELPVDFGGNGGVCIILTSEMS